MTIRLLTPSRSVESGKSLGIHKEYYTMFKKGDIELIIITSSSDKTYQSLLEVCDGLLLTGGNDVNPKYYNQPLHSTTHLEDSYIEYMEFKLLTLFNHAKKPIIGICRGIQTINVFFNGTLLQDINSQYFHSNVKTHQQINRDGYSHYIEIQPDTKLSKFITNKVLVNSFHHQNIDHLAPGFTITAYSEDGLIEGIEKGNIVAFQWHPEITNDATQEQIVAYIKSLF